MASGALPAIPGASYAIFHNTYADVAATTGLFGLIAMLLGVFLLPLRAFVRQLRSGVALANSWFALAGVGVIANNFVFGLSNSWLHLRGLPFVLLLMLVLLSGASKAGHSGSDASASSS